MPLLYVRYYYILYGNIVTISTPIDIYDGDLSLTLRPNSVEDLFVFVSVWNAESGAGCSHSFAHFVTWLAMGPQNYCENLKCKLENDKREEEKRKRIETKRNKATKRAETRRERRKPKTAIAAKWLRKVSEFHSARVRKFYPTATLRCDVWMYIVSYNFICLCVSVHSSTRLNLV